MKKINRILIIDDNEHVRDIIKLIINPSEDISEKVVMLEKSLFDEEDNLNPALPEIKIDEASQGEDAIEMVKQAAVEGAPYFLIITDVRMPPGIDGIKTSTAIRKIDPNIAIIIITAYNDYSKEEIISKFGSERLLFLIKPFDDEEIVNFILSHLRK